MKGGEILVAFLQMNGSIVVKRVLLVDDLPHMESVLGSLLKTVGDFEVVKCVSTEAEANLWIDENDGQWDLAVVDLVLGQGTGLGVVTRAKDRTAGKVVVFSEYASEAMRAHCLQIGADATFRKGSQAREFLAWCRAMAP